MREQTCAGCGIGLRDIDKDECAECGKLFCTDCLIIDVLYRPLCVRCAAEEEECPCENNYFTRIRPKGGVVVKDFDREECRYSDDDDLAPEYRPLF